MKPPTKLLLHLSLLLLPIVLHAYPSGAPPRFTGAPGDKNCITSGCHNGTVTDSSPAISVKFPNGATYTPGVKQRLTITANDPFAIRYGFEITARLASDLSNGQAGTLAPADATTAHTECDGGGNAPCASPTTVQFVTHSTPNPAGTWDIDWTAPAAGSGSVTLYLAVNASASSGSANKHIHLQSFPVTEATAAVLPAVTGIANGASFASVVAPSSYFTIAGTNLSSGTRTWASTDFTNNGTGLPTALDGTKVTINGKDAYVEFISPTQINAIVPGTVAPGAKVPVVVSLNGQASQQFMIQCDEVSPAFFTELPPTADAGKYIIAQHSADFSRVGKAGLYPASPNLTTPAKSGETVIFYGTSFGATTPAAPDGLFVSQVSNLDSLPTITVGGVQATVAFAGLVPPFASLYQFNVTLPANLPSGDQPVIATLANGVKSQSELITIQ